MKYNGKPKCLVKNDTEAAAWDINVASFHHISRSELTPAARGWLLGAVRRINYLLEVDDD